MLQLLICREKKEKCICAGGGREIFHVGKCREKTINHSENNNIQQGRSFCILGLTQEIFLNVRIEYTHICMYVCMCSYCTLYYKI